jgi:ABC-type nitrate/sulfonate/bicarbonate transport system substrate-binding protein
MRVVLKMAFAAALVSLTSLHASSAQDIPKIKLGYAKCAHCLPMSLTPDYAKNISLETINFNSGNDVLTALVSKSIDVAQVTYLHYITALDKGLDVVAVSGQINGGSECVSSNKLDLPGEDWVKFKSLTAKAKADGAPLKIAASRGNAQDIHMRGAFMKQGIDPNKDIQFVNIPNPSDHLAALQRGDVDMICSVEPFASQIKMAAAGKHFVLPYDQAAGNLTNLIVTRSDVIASNKVGVQGTVSAVVALVDVLKKDQTKWIETITKLTGLDTTVAKEALINAYPDYSIHMSSTLAIADMMRDLKYISSDVSAAAKKNIDYSFLIAATGKPKSALGE